MKRTIKYLTAMASAGLMVLSVFVFSLSVLMPDCYYVVQGESLYINSGLDIKALGFAQEMPREVYSQIGNTYKMQLTLAGGPVIKTVDVQVIDRDMVIPGGSPFGIKMFTEGVMVVGISGVDTDSGMVNPAKRCGIKTGDIIVEIDNKKILQNEQVGNIVAASKGRDLDVLVQRKGVSQSVTLTPAKSQTGEFKAGMWVRDSSAGIGTMTFYSPEKQSFVGLGHAICDVDTGEIMPLYSGEAVDVTITGANKGVSGFPGELTGVFGPGPIMGALTLNCETGIYGRSATAPIVGTPIPLATKNEVKIGTAHIYSTIKGKETQRFEISIERIITNGSSPTKNMIIKVTDPMLLSKTGGIVQGMSGSPIIQDGKLIGAVTHVFVNDPTRGYAIFAENMMDMMDKATPKDLAA